MKEIGRSEAADRFGARLALLLLVLLPVGYVGTLLAVVVHEVVGHGGMAVALGGSLQGFEVHWDGMGWASTRIPPATSPGSSS